MKGLNLDGFKKVQEGEHSATFQHEHGHKITIAKTALSDGMKEQLKALPLHKVDGGEIPDFLTPNAQPEFDANQMVQGAMNPKNIQIPTPEERLQSNVLHEAARRGIDPEALQRNPEAAKDLESQVIRQMGVNNVQAAQQNQAKMAQIQQSNHERQLAGLPPEPLPPELQQMQQAQRPQQQMQGATTGQPMQDVQQMAQQPGDVAYGKGLGEGHAAIAMQLKADLARGQAEQDALRESAAQQATLNQRYQDSLARAQSERKSFMNDYNDGHIDPRHYLDSMGGGKRVATAIGLILGGMGGGLTGQGNPALAFLQNQIDRDINSQVQNLDKKKGLLAANTQTFQDLHSGMTATRANLNDIISMKLKQAAASTSDPQARARALAAASHIDMQSADHLTNMAMRQGALGAAANGSVDPARLVTTLVPQHHQAAVFKEIEKAQDVRNITQVAKDAFEQAAKENTVMRTGAGLLRVPGSVGALQQALMPTLKDLEGTVRQAAVDSIKNTITPMPGDDEHKIATKRQTLINYLKSNSSAPVAKGFGIDLDRYQSTSNNPEMQLNPQQKQWLQWSRQNPNDPNAQAFMKKMGLK
jgi:hypothetical protein